MVINDAPILRPREKAATIPRDEQSTKKSGLSWLVYSLLVLVGFFAACSIILAIFLLRRPADDAAIGDRQPVEKESQLASEASAVDPNADPKLAPDPEASSNKPSLVVDTPSEPGTVPEVFSTLSVGNKLGYSISISAEVFEKRRRVAVGSGGMGFGSGGGATIGRGRGGMRTGGGGGFGGKEISRDVQSQKAKQDSKEVKQPVEAETVRWEGLASYAVTKKSGRRETGSSNAHKACGLGIPGRYVLVSPFEITDQTEVRVRINGRDYKAMKAPSGSQRTFMALKVDSSPVDFQPLPASRAAEIQPYKRFNKSVWNSVWKDVEGVVMTNRAVAISSRSNSLKTGTVCWRDTGKIGGVCFAGNFVSARKIQDWLPEDFGTVFKFELDRNRKSNFADTERIEKQISGNLVEVTFETKGDGKTEDGVPAEEIQIKQDAWLGQFIEEPNMPNERPNLRGPFIFESSNYWHPVSLSFVDGNFTEKNKDPRAPASMPLLLPRLDQIVFQDFAKVSKDTTQDALFITSGKVKLLEDGEAQNIPLKTQYRIGKYNAKLTSIETGDQSTKVFRKTTIATSGAKAPSKGSRSGTSSSGNPYTFPMRIEQDEVIEFDNQTGLVLSVEISGAISQGEGAKRQATVPYTVKIERTSDSSPILVPSASKTNVVSGANKKLELSSTVRDRVVDLLTSPSLENRAKGLEMLNLYEPRKEQRIAEALSRTLDNGYWGSDLIYKLACDWLYDSRIHNLLKDVDQRNDFQRKPMEQQAILFLVEKFPPRAFIEGTYVSLFKGLLRNGDKPLQQETIRVLSENFPRLFEKIMLESEMFQNPNRKPSLSIIELLGMLGTSRTIDELSDRAEKIEAKKKPNRNLQRNEGQRLRAYQAAIEQIKNRENERRN